MSPILTSTTLEEKSRHAFTTPWIYVVPSSTKVPLEHSHHSLLRSEKLNCGTRKEWKIFKRRKEKGWGATTPSSFLGPSHISLPSFRPSHTLCRLPLLWFAFLIFDPLSASGWHIDPSVVAEAIHILGLRCCSASPPYLGSANELFD